MNLLYLGCHIIYCPNSEHFKSWWESYYMYSVTKSTKWAVKDKSGYISTLVMLHKNHFSRQVASVTERMKRLSLMMGRKDPHSEWKTWALRAAVYDSLSLRGLAVPSACRWHTHTHMRGSDVSVVHSRWSNFMGSVSRSPITGWSAHKPTALLRRIVLWVVGREFP